MARFYARFDSGSTGGANWNPAGLENSTTAGYFERRFFGANSASGALLRDGLIASRSALSTDVYVDLDAGNKDGSKGIYFPPDSGPFSTDTSTFVSWSNAYTSSVAGLVIPADYRTRPTASITSNQTTLVGPATPVDSIGASYTTYINASNAVKTALDTIRSGSDAVTNYGPFARLGANESRTLHSIWHDPDLQYFAWDDFTPGTASNFALADSGSGYGTAFYWTGPFSYRFTWGPDYQYRSDEIASASLSATFRQTGSSTPTQTLSTNLRASDQLYDWSITVNPTNGEYEIDASIVFKDFTITSNQGQASTISDGARLALTRLYSITLAYNSSFSSTCGEYTGATTRYATRNAPLEGGDYIYVTTNSNNPAAADIGFYYDSVSDNVYEIQGGGLVESTILDCD